MRGPSAELARGPVARRGRGSSIDVVSDAAWAYAALEHGVSAQGPAQRTLSRALSVMKRRESKQRERELKIRRNSKTQSEEIKTMRNKAMTALIELLAVEGEGRNVNAVVTQILRAARARAASLSLSLWNRGSRSHREAFARSFTIRRPALLESLPKASQKRVAAAVLFVQYFPASQRRVVSLWNRSVAFSQARAQRAGLPRGRPPHGLLLHRGSLRRQKRDTRAL